MAFNPGDIVKKTAEVQRYQVITSDDQKTVCNYDPNTCPIVKLTFLTADLVQVS